MELEDAAVVYKNERGRVKITQTTQKVAKGSQLLFGGWWGLLIGLLLGGPLLGAVIGAAVFGIGAHRLDLGIDDDFIKKAGAALKPGGSALLIQSNRSPEEAARAVEAELGCSTFSTELDAKATERTSSWKVMDPSIGDLATVRAMTRPATPPIPLAAEESTTLLAFLDFYRAALLDRAWGLSDEQLNIEHQPSSLTLSRLIGHMSLVEYEWFRVRFVGGEMPEPFASLDWDADRDAEMTLAETWPVDELLSHFNVAVSDSRARVEAATSLDQLSARPDSEGEHWNLRWILVHMIEEYARHCGHADLIRESIDGDVDHPF